MEATATPQPQTKMSLKATSPEMTWAILQSKAGNFVNLGLDENGIYEALKRYATKSGMTVSDESIRKLAAWAADEEADDEADDVIEMPDELRHIACEK